MKHFHRLRMKLHFTEAAVFSILTSDCDGRLPSSACDLGDRFLLRADAQDIEKFYREKTAMLLMTSSAGGECGARGRPIACRIGIPDHPSVVPRNMPAVPKQILEQKDWPALVVSQMRKPSLA